MTPDDPATVIQALRLLQNPTAIVLAVALCLLHDDPDAARPLAAGLCRDDPARVALLALILGKWNRAGEQQHGTHAWQRKLETALLDAVRR